MGALEPMRAMSTLEGGPCAMIAGMIQTLKWCAGNKKHFFFINPLSMASSRRCAINLFPSRSLGLTGGQATRRSRFGRVPDNFIMDDVKCSGRERRLEDCKYKFFWAFFCSVFHFFLQAQ